MDNIMDFFLIVVSIVGTLAIIDWMLKPTLGDDDSDKKKVITLLMQIRRSQRRLESRLDAELAHRQATQDPQREETGLGNAEFQ